MSFLSPKSEEEAEVRDGYLLLMACAGAIFLCSYLSHLTSKQKEAERVRITETCLAHTRGR